MWEGIAWGIGGFVFASFCEYWGHRLMHKNIMLGATHRNHHATGIGQGVALEYFDYLKFAVLLMWEPFLISLPAGIGWLVGANLFALFSAFAHQLQHDNPTKCFWMPMPIHYVHHHHKMWHYNFGMAVDWWDRVFGTYQFKDDWNRDLEPALSQKSIFQIRWW
ncbi:MAG TPA: sterol desaturase family protein [Pirellulales bacterium]|nr:sterol desaturase family protein [Pirellulales bacterium]